MRFGIAISGPKPLNGIEPALANRTAQTPASTATTTARKTRSRRCHEAVLAATRKGCRHEASESGIVEKDLAPAERVDDPAHGLVVVITQCDAAVEEKEIFVAHTCMHELVCDLLQARLPYIAGSIATRARASASYLAGGTAKAGGRARNENHGMRR